jgi:hypothetical protein
MFLNEDPLSLALKAVSLSNTSGPLLAVPFRLCFPEVFFRFGAGVSVKENGSAVVSLASRRALEISTSSLSLSIVVMPRRCLADFRKTFCPDRPKSEPANFLEPGNNSMCDETACFE